MTRSFISYLFVVSLLFMSIESAVDSVGGEHAHGHDYAHILDTDESSSPDLEDTDDHCQHCCHGHSSSIPTNLTVTRCVPLIDLGFSVYVADVLNFGQAPPTPPPNA